MDGVFWLNVVMRWVHVASAVVAVGGLVFLGWVLLPVAGGVGSEAGRSVVDAANRRFKRIFHIAIGLLLLSGAYNFMMVLPRAEGLAGLKPLYHALLGTKLLLGILLIGIGIGWIGRAARGERMPTGRDPMLSAAILLALIVLLLSATLRRVWDRHPGVQAPVIGRAINLTPGPSPTRRGEPDWREGGHRRGAVVLVRLTTTRARV